MIALIVDDSKVVRTATSRILAELGIGYDTADDGKMALEKVQNTKFDFVLLDWNMPKMDGLEFFKAAKKVQNFIDTKVIFCTTESEVEKISKALNEGVNEYIMKPFDKEIIEDKLRFLGLI